MVDFMKVSMVPVKNGVFEIKPEFIVGKSKDLMIRGGDFYAIWLEDQGRWSTDEDDALNLIDAELRKYWEERKDSVNGSIKVQWIRVASTGTIDKFHKFCQKQQRDCFHALDERIIFANDPVKKEDYASRRLSYSLEEGPLDSYNRLMSVLYSEEERRKIEWAIGAIVTGDSVKIQKFLVLYGAQGTGKSTILKIIANMFEGYCTGFSSKVLGQSNNPFTLEAFKENPLVAIDHEGKLSKIEDNTSLNTLISHELMLVNTKYEKQYKQAFKTFLLIGTNEPVRITDSKSGLLRRLIDVRPTGDKLPKKEYDRLFKLVGFEYGAIAYHCKQVYLEDPDYYEDYIPRDMLSETNDFYDYIMTYYLEFSDEDETTLKVAWERYKHYCDDAMVPYKLKQIAFKAELKNYFQTYEERGRLKDGSQAWNVYSGFRADKFVTKAPKRHTTEDGKLKIIFKEQPSKLDEFCSDCPAQLATKDETPRYKWENVRTKLEDIDTSKLHYVKVPKQLITIDFDIPDEEGNKCFEKNLQAATLWPPTYAELSKSGEGIHLHYIYSGDPEKLARVYGEHIEIKVNVGNSSLRRKLTKCNDLPIATISSGLPLKGEDKVVNFDSIKSEKGLRTLIVRNLAKDIHPGTKPSMDFIKKILDDAYASGLHYDVRDMRQDILTFAMGSTNKADYCVGLMPELKLCSEDASENVPNDEQPYIFYDVEVFPNLFVVCWCKLTEEELHALLERYDNGDGEPLRSIIKDLKIVKMINPTPTDIEKLCKYRLIGFNNTSYDNNMLYARILGYKNPDIYKLSQKNINRPKGSYEGTFYEARNLGYTDIFDFASASNKKSLKKLEIDMDVPHQELGLKWDEEVPEELWEKVALYCCNDVAATVAAMLYLWGDWTARQILADLAGMPVSTSTNNLTTRIIFGTERHPELVYTDFSTGKSTDGTYNKFNKFDTYEYISPSDSEDHKPHNMYRGEDVGFGGWNFSDPGIYYRVKTFDVQGEHPASIRFLNLFKDYTKRFGELVDLRVAIKHKDYKTARKMMDGKVSKYLEDDSTAKALSNALKTAVNAVYGLTAASWDHPMHDPRNVNNIVALRGALFMVTLKAEVEKRGFHVISCKTDSLKVVDPSPEIEEFIFNFGKDYGYNFEIENVFERICLVNTSTFIAKCADDDPDTPGQWLAKAEQFAVPYLFKSLFTHEDLTFRDFCETFSVKEGDIYIDMNEGYPDVTALEKEKKKYQDDYRKGTLSDTTFEKKMAELDPEIAKGHNYIFVGRVGLFSPIQEGKGGGVLYRYKDGKYFAMQGTKGYRWLESDDVKALHKEGDIDISYYDKLCDEAIKAIEKYGDFEQFVSGSPISLPNDDFMNIPEDLDGDEMPFEDIPVGKEKKKK